MVMAIEGVQMARTRKQAPAADKPVEPAPPAIGPDGYPIGPDGYEEAVITPLPEIPGQSPTEWLRDGGIANNPRVKGETVAGWHRRLVECAYYATGRRIEPSSVKTLIARLRRRKK
jgi:hypothetical protein